MNKRTEALHEKCERLGIDPFEALLQFANHPDPMYRLSALKEICQYLYPKRRAIEITDKVNPKALVHLEEFSQLSEQELMKVIETEFESARRLVGGKVE